MRRIQVNRQRPGARHPHVGFLGKTRPPAKITVLVVTIDMLMIDDFCEVKDDSSEALLRVAVETEPNPPSHQ
jgi:hypothetical protein